VAEFEQMPEGATCEVEGCEATGLGTRDGGAPMQCGAMGSTKGPCIADWLTSDPEDREPWVEFVADWRARRG